MTPHAAAGSPSLLGSPSPRCLCILSFAPYFKGLGDGWSHQQNNSFVCTALSLPCQTPSWLCFCPLVSVSKKDITALENVQKLACRITTRFLESSYQDLLNRVSLPSLEYRRLETRLCTLYKIIYNLCYFESGIFTTVSHRAHHNLVLNRPFAWTNSYFYSFVPHTTFLWNNLDFSLVCAPSLFSFRSKLHSSSFIYFSSCLCVEEHV